MKLLNSKTYYNLAKSYAGECQAHVKYKFIEYGARKEGYTALAEIIDKVVYNEFIHARMFYTFIQEASDKPIANIEICGGYPFKEKWDLIENLRFASEDERAESDEIYAEFERVAREEVFDEIDELYKDIRQVENCHSLLFKDLYEQMSTGTLYKKETPVKWKCGACGYEETGKEAFKVCPICKAKQGVVMLKLNDGN
ncbi:MAG: rubrerythrin family protein [Clostridia bacterium]|nr:rubrerythrin family protein [Clostridia bacterium]